MLWIGGRRRGVGRMWSLSRSERCVCVLREREREKIEVWCGGGDGGGGDGKANDECINKND